MIIDGDVEIFPAGAAGAISLVIAGDAVAGAFDAGKLLEVEMEEVARVFALIAEDGSRWAERAQTGRATTQEARRGSLEELGAASNLEAGEPPATQGEHAGHSQRVAGSGEHLGRKL